MGSDELVTRLLAEEAEVRRLTTQLQGCIIMAEGFKARVAELTAQLAEARESEQAAVVAWLKNHGFEGLGGGDWSFMDHIENIAEQIEEGEHLK